MPRSTLHTRRKWPDANFWKKQLRQWHWISSAICLAGLLLFAATGVTLNHASSIEAEPKTVIRETQLPPALLGQLASVQGGRPLPDVVAMAIEKATGVAVARAVTELRDDELFIDLPGPGVDASLSIDLQTGLAEHERIDRGAIAVLNDLHKGRDTGPVWAWFIDIIAVACVLFSLTGLGLLWVHAKRRPSTWPLTGLGLVIPLILYLVFIHS